MSANLVRNPSFEDFTGGFGGDGGAELSPGDTTLTNWDIVFGKIAILKEQNSYNLTANPSNDANFPNGTNFLDLTGYDTLGGVSQSLTGLVIGQLYLFKMDLGVRNGDCGSANCEGPISVEVDLFGSGVTSTSFTYDSNDQGTIWQSHTFQFVADSTNPILAILGISGNQFIGLDNVSVETVTGGAVPEPSSLLLFGSGLLGLALWRRKQTV